MLLTGGYAGEQEVSRIYLGSNLVYEKDTPPVGETFIVNMNFSVEGRSDDDAAGWNTLRFPDSPVNDPSSVSFSNLFDDNNVNRNIGLELVSITGSVAVSDVSGSETNPIPQLYVIDLYGGDGSTSEPTSTMKLTGLDPALTYDLRFVNEVTSGVDIRITIDEVAVTPTYDYPTTDSFDDSSYMSFNDVSPNGQGEIEFIIDGYGQSFWGLFGMRVRQNGSNPPPSGFRMVDISSTDSGYGFAESLPSNYDSSPQASLPLILFMHGDGERGNGSLEDLEKLLTWGIPKFAEDGTWIAKDDFVMLAPQSDTNGYNLGNLNDFIDWAIINYKIDPSKIYGVGLSMGAWDMLTDIGTNGTSTKFSKLVPLSALLAPSEGGTFAIAAQSDVPVWILTNLNDPSVAFDPPDEWGGVLETRDSINAINAGQVRLSVFDRSDHHSLWDPVCQGEWMGTEMGAYDAYNETIYDWLNDNS